MPFAPCIVYLYLLTEHQRVILEVNASIYSTYGALGHVVLSGLRMGRSRTLNMG